MNNEYVIINRTAVQKRIEELEALSQENKYAYNLCQIIIVELKLLLSQSTPLIPVVEMAFDAGGAYTLGSHKEFTQTHPNRQDYITNLKLDI